ncbi:MAG: hypothetical protein GWN02_28540 [Gemmatimonadetes bacterium]|nr:hypothetical protein [Actinomycetota bacterium]NIV58382.1 hypothetical protein [Actinomycetota bacterium]NIX53179.1 hypothetical protein [Actinomycetota bacterium]NIY11971.1 hypothetical protein [Gemmatimonadota bacterium]
MLKAIPGSSHAPRRRAALRWSAMGFNPFRPQRVSFVDVAMVAGTILAAVALVLWAALSA